MNQKEQQSYLGYLLIHYQQNIQIQEFFQGIVLEQNGIKKNIIILMNVKKILNVEVVENV